MKSLKALKQNNKGAGIVTVIVILSFLTTLGLLIMAISYTSSEMKSSERTGREVAYNAAGVVEQMRSGAELAVSDSIKNCYTQVMTNYSLYRDDIEVSFDRFFNSSLNEWKPYYIGDDSKTYYYTDSAPTLDKTQGMDFLCGDVETYHTEGTKTYQVHKGYNIKALEKFVKAGFGGDAVVGCIPANADSPNIGVAQWSFETEDGVKTPKSVTLKDIQVSYKRLLRTVKITTDIVIEFPDLGYVFNEESQGSKFTEFAVIALDALNQQTGYVNIEGKAYAGKVNISGTNFQHKLKLKPGGLLITPGDITVKGNNEDAITTDVQNALANIEDEDQREAERLKVASSFMIDNGSTLWANGINLMQNGVAALCYRTNVKNDLNLTSSGSAALLAGDYYYGFGDSDSNPDESSSILVQGFNTSTTDEKNNPVLSIYNLNNLTLAGYAFVNDGTTTGGVKTGQSMAVTEDQTAYLMPMEMLDYEDFAIKISTNPEVFAPDMENSLTSAQVYANYCAQLATKLTSDNRPNNPKQKTLWTISGVEKKPADYGITIKPVSIPYAGYTIGYFFMEFDTPEHANQYFRDYFQTNTARIQNYLNQYVSLTDTANYAGTVGNTFTFNKLTEKFLLRNINSVINISSIRSAVEKKLAAFGNLCVTLNEGFGAENALEEDLGTNEEKEARAGATNPFNYYVREDVVNAALNKAAEQPGYDAVNTTIWFYNTAGLPVAVVTRNQDFTYTSSLSSVCLIIALGDVTIQSDFTGLIICKGNVNVQVDTGSTVTLTADSDAVTEAMGTVSQLSRDQLDFEPLEDIDTDGVMPFEFLFYRYTPATSTDISDVGSYWDVSTLVHFDKWKKN